MSKQAKEIHYAWIEQILSFPTEPERSAYVQKSKETAKHKRQPDVCVLDEYEQDGRFAVRLRKPYNNNPMPPEPDYIERLY